MVPLLRPIPRHSIHSCVHDGFPFPHWPTSIFQHFNNFIDTGQLFMKISGRPPQLAPFSSSPTSFCLSVWGLTVLYRFRVLTRTPAGLKFSPLFSLAGFSWQIFVLVSPCPPSGGISISLTASFASARTHSQQRSAPFFFYLDKQPSVVKIIFCTCPP